MSEGQVPGDVVATIPGAAGATWSRLAGLTGGAWLLRPVKGDAVVVRPAADQEVLAAKAAAATDIGPRVVAVSAGWLAVEYLQGRHVGAVELGRPTVLAELGHLLRRWHETGLTLPDSPLLSARAGYLEGIPSDEVPTALKVDAVRAEEWEAELADASDRRVPAHLDVVANLLETPRGLRLIDFEYAAGADPARELGQVVWEAELDRSGLERLVGAYGTDTGVAAEATAVWAWLTGVTWTLWAMAHRADPTLEQYARRSWERLQCHWSRPGG